MSWELFKKDLKDALVENATKDKEPLPQAQEFQELAKTITDLYHNTAIASTTGLLHTVLFPALLTPGKAALQSAIAASLTLMFNANLNASTVTLMPIGLATVAYWSPAIAPVVLNFLPPYPITAVRGPGTFIIFPGNPMLVTNGFKKAYTSYKNSTDFMDSLDKVAQDITDGFKAHMASIAGIHISIPPPPAVPVPIPWFGMKP